MYDVMVVGAGPAGATCAKVLAESGKSVLLVEKFKLPRYKSCSGQIIKKTVDLVREYYGEDIPESVMCLPIENRGMVFTDDKGRCSRYEQPGFNVWRSSFDKWLTDKAGEAGAEIRDCTTVLDFKERDDNVCVTLKGDNTYEEYARYVVDCEGVVGSLKKKLLGCNLDYVMTYQTYNQGGIDLDYHYFYAYLQPEFSEYDAWFNVKDNQLVLGVSVKKYDKVEQYYARFIQYMTSEHGLHIDKQLKIDRWLMPLVKPGCPIDYGVGRILFAGEVAGFLNPMGEGISAGLESGYYAAMAIKNYSGDIDKIHSIYKESLSALQQYMKHQWDLVACMTSTFDQMRL